MHELNDKLEGGWEICKLDKITDFVDERFLIWQILMSNSFLNVFILGSIYRQIPASGPVA